MGGYIVEQVGVASTSSLWVLIGWLLFWNLLAERCKTHEQELITDWKLQQYAKTDFESQNKFCIIVKRESSMSHQLDFLQKWSQINAFVLTHAS